MEVSVAESNDNIITNVVSKKRNWEDEDDSTEFDSVSPESKRLNVATDSCLDFPPESDRVEPEANLDSARCDSPVSEVCQIDYGDNSVESNETGDAEESAASPEVVKFREDILDILDEPETVPDAQDLDSVIRSFEEEILQLSPSLSHRADGEMTSFPGETQPDLGYLLEASDDELGLPPTVAVSGDSSENQPMNPAVSNEAVVDGIGDMVGFQDELPCYGSFDFGMEDGVPDGQNYGENGNGDFVTVDGLFDYADGSEFSDLAWRPESLPAL
ncbi:OLC1v1014217C1 [Oldenlandia corymbosa var. corymbosa]|uniref:OLC1v1014217C1 n=1 Tax=Oldenlandia corymbosa var. corymbosa TaxID=529605 RepID=A0AAV1E064_OLDCO|nr:OLC1v1014217C1 [Oldenlandia corymbosa var. corymbosa]